MPMTDKNEAVVSFIRTCPLVDTNPLFFNFGNVEDGASQLTTQSNDTAMHKPYVDGSVLRRYTFTIDCFRSVSYNPTISGLSDENIEDIQSVQSLLDWIDAQGEMGNFPDFGDDCIVESMETLSTNPDIVGVDTSMSPPNVVYRISVEIYYIDTTKRIWN